jgi:hypothetical protein
MKAVSALALAATFSVGATPAARADILPPEVVSVVTTIVPGAGAIKSYIDYAESAYNSFLKYVTKPNKVPADLDPIKSAIAQSTAAIAAHDDALVNGMVKSCVDDADIALGGITTMTRDAQLAAATAAVHCVTLAKNEIAPEGKAGVDTLGLALNTVGPVALYMQAFVGQPTDILLKDIIFANQQLIAKLEPTCGVSSDWSHAEVNAAISATGSAVPGDWDHIAVPGHGACYNYTKAAPTPDGVLVFPTGEGAGADTWTVTGEGVPEICAGVFLCGAHVVWPGVTDHSVAVNEAMAKSSYPVAAAALHRLLPAVPVSGAPVAMAATVPDRSGVQIFAFGVNPDGKLFSTPMALNGAAAPVWREVVGAPELKSVAAATNADGRVEVFGLDRVGSIFHSWRTGGEFGSWSPWAKMEGTLSSIAVARNKNGTLEVFGTTPAGTVFTRHQILNADYIASQVPAVPKPSVNNWSDWKQIQGILDSISAVTDDNGKIQIFAVKAGNLFQKEQAVPNATDPNTNWSGWVNLGLPPALTHSMSVVRDSIGRLQIFADSGSAVYQSQRSPDGHWDFAWAKIPPGNNITGVAAVTTGNTSVLLGVSPNGTSFTNVAVNGSIGGWMGWGSFGGATLRKFS